MNKQLALIVEDNVELGNIYTAALQMANYDEIEHIIDGKAALDRLSGSVPGLLILDMNLPYVSGHYIYKQLRSDSRYDRTPVIIATANALIADALASEIRSIDRLMIKPVSPGQLRDMAKEVRAAVE